MSDGTDRLRAWAPDLITAARSGDLRLSLLCRQALSALYGFDLPCGVKIDDAWIGVLPRKLQGVNRWMSSHFTRKQIRKDWTRALWTAICRVEKVASRDGLQQLGRAPTCTIKMQVQIVRLVSSVREFIRDDDSLGGAPKQLYDALQDVGLIHEDRREWLVMHPPVQDVSTIPAQEWTSQHPRFVPVTLFLLWPDPIGHVAPVRPPRRSDATLQGHTHPAAPRESRAEERGAGAGRTTHDLRRRVGPRSVDV